MTITITDIVPFLVVFIAGMAVGSIIGIVGFTRGVRRALLERGKR